MHVLYIVERYPKWSEQFVAREIEALRELGVEVSVFSLRPPLRAEGPRLQDSRIVYASWRQVLKGFLRSPLRCLVLEAKAIVLSMARASCEPYAAYLGAAALLGSTARSKPGWDHVHGAFAGLPATTAMFYASLTHCPWSFAAHARDALVRPLMLRRKLCGARAAVACTEYIAGTLRERVPPADQARIHVLYHGLPAGLLRRLLVGSERRAQRPATRILAVGRLVPKKGFAHLLDALELLRKQGAHFACTIVGDGPDRALLERRICELGLTELVTLTGAQPPDDTVQTYLEADLFVLPAVVAPDGDRDGLPNVLLEAAAARLPIVTTPVGGIGEFIRDGETGLLVPPGDAAALAAAIQRLMADEELRRRLGENACRGVEARFRIEQNARELAERLGWLARRDAR